jgi:DNA-binding MarR family transcriptional regulator
MTMDRAEKRGLVERIPSTEDQRAATIRVTARGRKLSRTIADAVGAEIAVLVQPLSAAEQDRLATLIWRVLPVEPEK